MQRWVLIWMVCVGSWGLSLSAQSLKTPGELLAIAQDSPVEFSFREVKKWTGEHPQHSNLNDYFIYPSTQDGERILLKYELSPYAERNWELAEKARKKGEAAEARKFYEAVLERDPGYAPAMTSVGQMWELEGKPEQAREAYRKAIELNFYDYMAHWSLALNLHQHKFKESAAREIATAWILNRNAPDLKADARDIFKASGIKFRDWDFCPECELQAGGDKVQVVASTPWLSFCLCRGVWAFDPNYRLERGGPEDFNLEADKECLFGLVLSNSNDAGTVKSKDLSLRALGRALSDGYLYEYILFEMWIPREPLIAFLQPEEAFPKMVDYLIEVRSKK